ncbi:uncharacterized protein at3g15000 mitochondrial [Phtheirospermum japonicum]|uniref:Uncharacterized protein at3g15000 mitochondrial n=1 Tax=Phtheirospermum japonicum TaxID=374723 RepID=A0A830CLN3_9LAMI|nr:uncharacterized protein at3g15000 mitochondrial [Phtheirospermum japonicum]
MVATHGDWVFTQQAEMFPGMDYKHWEVNMQYEVGEGGATKDQIIDCYIKTLAHILGSEEEAKKKIYKVICRPRADLVFGCELDWETAYKLEDLPQVDYVTADYYSNSETKDYGGELFVDGKIVQRSPE